MSGLVEELVSLHAEHGLDGVKGVPQYQALCARHSGDPGLPSTLNCVRDVLEQLEVGLQGLPKEQVRFALEELSGCRLESDRLSICRELVMRRSAQYWSQAQREYFAVASDKIANWNQFFLSFTSFHPTPREVLFVNNRHCRLIDYGLKQVFGPPDTLSENLLARLINYLLEGHDLSGFYYTKHRDDRDVEEKLRSEAGRSVAFVQILAGSMFRRWPNFCWLEYDAAAADATRSVIFVMPERRDEFIKRHNVDRRLRAWYDVAVKKLDAASLVPVTEHETIEATLSELEREVVGRVQRAWDRLFEAIPD